MEIPVRDQDSEKERKIFRKVENSEKTRKRFREKKRREQGETVERLKLRWFWSSEFFKH